MSEDQGASQSAESIQPTELDMLKSRAKLMGIAFSNNISLETLRERIRAKQDGEPEPSTTAPLVNALLNGEAVPTKRLTIRQHLYNEQMKLVRLRITCMDPKKKDLQGEIFTVANEYMGTVRKFIPFGEATENGFHVPYCLYRMLEAKKFLNITTRKDPHTKQLVVSSQWAKEFSLEILPQLDPKELARLATAQLASGSTQG